MVGATLMPTCPSVPRALGNVGAPDTVLLPGARRWCPPLLPILFWKGGQRPCGLPKTRGSQDKRSGLQRLQDRKVGGQGLCERDSARQVLKTLRCD